MRRSSPRFYQAADHRKYASVACGIPYCGWVVSVAAGVATLRKRRTARCDNGVSVATTGSDKTLWGTFSAQDVETHSLDQRPDLVAMSRGEMYLASCCNILRYGHGFVAATNAAEPKDAGGNWIPLFTYPCVEYLRQFDLRTKRVFEWGSGASTLFWMQRAQAVTSVENNRDWYDIMLRMKNDRSTLILESTDRFPFLIREQAGLFDVIVVDSYGYRYDCAAEAIPKLAPGGMIILDNSDWHPATAAMLKQSGLIQVDFSGFKVTECHASTTSVFLQRAFDFPVLGTRQPAYCVGAKKTVSGWDKPYAQRPADKD